MASDLSGIRSALGDLIQACKDGEKDFRSSARHLADISLRQLFQSYSTQRAQFACELQVAVSQLGGDPPTSGTTTGAIHRGWMDLKRAIAGNDDLSILEEAERGEDSTMRSYRAAMQRDFPDDLHFLIERQYRDVSQTHKQVRSLRDSRAFSGAAR